jgi:hypothetical protein
MRAAPAAGAPPAVGSSDAEAGPISEDEIAQIDEIARFLGGAARRGDNQLLMAQRGAARRGDNLRGDARTGDPQAKIATMEVSYSRDIAEV